MSRNILVTGVSSGIGWGLARHYLAGGDEVYGISRREPPELLSQAGFHFQSLDLTDEDAVRRSLPQLLEGVTQLDVVILNAGTLGRIADMGEVTLDELRETMEVNVWANKTALDTLFGMQLSIAQVITVSSGAAVNGNRGWNGYSISKAALNMLTKLYAAERAETHFVALAPGLVDTAMQDYLCSLNEEDRFPSLEALKSRRNTPEMPSPAELAPRLAHVIDALPSEVESGEFVDIRDLSMAER